MSASFRKYSGIIAVLVVSLGILYSYSKVAPNYELASFSDLGVISETRMSFVLTLVAGALLTYVFLVYYVARNFDVDKQFQLLSLVAAMAQVVVALIPADVERPALLVTHWSAGLILYLSIAGIMHLFAANQSEHLPAELQTYSVLVVVVTILSAIVLSAVFTESFTLAQAMGAAVFFYWIVRVTFIVPTKQSTVVNDNQ